MSRNGLHSSGSCLDNGKDKRWCFLDKVSYGTTGFHKELGSTKQTNKQTNKQINKHTNTDISLNFARNTLFNFRSFEVNEEIPSCSRLTVTSRPPLKGFCCHHPRYLNSALNNSFSWSSGDT